MKISRWIYAPLIFALMYAVLMMVFGQDVSFEMFLYFAAAGALMGFLGQYENDAKARKFSKGKDKRAFEVNQNRSLVLLLDYEKSFDLCRKAISKIKDYKFKSENFENGEIKAKTGLTWDLNGYNIEINLRRINENLTEIEFFIRPRSRTRLMSDGESWKIAEEICHYLKEKDAEINKKVLAESVEIIKDVYVKPFQKEKV